MKAVRYFHRASVVLRPKRLATAGDIEKWINSPTWSVKSLIDGKTELSKNDLRRLLLLSGLKVRDEADFDKLRADLEKQLHFIEKIQQVDAGDEMLSSLEQELQTPLDLAQLKKKVAESEEVLEEEYENVRGLKWEPFANTAKVLKPHFVITREKGVGV
ncbi:hypothetical protein CANCADRAFT_4559 [Tortispora caseinolytica NRRL Y-17796]|uniref:Glutamyl-tRNA(Gln) amidotransferase subunit F, mitochondrial n=1 Tax=Tortispora caseinolytica NRRL Y-17796 TaxID=767744 RepID=A0A1E4T9J1_9ASCO|nr:hypothetical protein CANCADRAFT_4559 [Tortispora caseinolytica NRRL Y-17796]